MSIEDKIINKIKNEKLEPKPLWYFLARYYLLWSAVFAGVVSAALAIAPIIFIVSNLELGFIKHINNSPLQFILRTLPYPWIIICILSTIMAIYAWKNTKRGYKFRGRYLTFTAILVALILGIVLNIFSLGRELDRRAPPFMPGYMGFEGRYNQDWDNKNEGRMHGTILFVGTNYFTIESGETTENIFYNLNLPGIEHIVVNQNIRVIGYIENQEFIGCLIFPDNFKKTSLGGNRNISDNKNNFNFSSSTATTSPKERMDFIMQNENCKQLINQGRANFKKPSKDNIDKIITETK